MNILNLNSNSNSEFNSNSDLIYTYRYINVLDSMFAPKTQQEDGTFRRKTFSMKVEDISFHSEKSLYEYIYSNNSIVRIYFDYDGDTKYDTKQDFEQAG